MDRTMERLINLREQLAVSAGDGSLRCWRMWIKLGDPDLMAGCAAEAAHDGLAAYAIDDALQELSVLRAKLEAAEQEKTKLTAWQPIATCPEGVNVALLWTHDSENSDVETGVVQAGHKADWWDDDDPENNPTHWHPLPPQEG